jgi:hypothetical protein
LANLNINNLKVFDLYRNKAIKLSRGTAPLIEQLLRLQGRSVQRVVVERVQANNVHIGAPDAGLLLSSSDGANAAPLIEARVSPASPEIAAVDKKRAKSRR